MVMRVYFGRGDAGVRESEPYDPQGDRQKAARYDAIQRNLWGNDNLPPRGRPRRSPGAVPSLRAVARDGCVIFVAKELALHSDLGEHLRVGWAVLAEPRIA